MIPMSKSRRRRRSKTGGGKPTLAQPSITLAPGSVPTDEQLEIELRELEEKTQGKYDLAKNDVTLHMLQKMSGEKLAELGKSEEISDAKTLSKQKLVFEILKVRAEKQGLMIAEGTLEVMSDGFGFLRSPEYSYMPCADDVYVSPSQIRRFGLRKGQVIKGGGGPGQSFHFGKGGTLHYGPAQGGNVQAVVGPKVASRRLLLPFMVVPMAIVGPEGSTAKVAMGIAILLPRRIPVRPQASQVPLQLVGQIPRMSKTAWALFKQSCHQSRVGRISRRRSFGL